MVCSFARVWYSVAAAENDPDRHKALKRGRARIQSLSFLEDWLQKPMSWSPHWSISRCSALRCRHAAWRGLVLLLQLKPPSLLFPPYKLTSGDKGLASSLKLSWGGQQRQEVEAVTPQHSSPPSSSPHQCCMMWALLLRGSLGFTSEMPPR